MICRIIESYGYVTRRLTERSGEVNKTYDAAQQRERRGRESTEDEFICTEIYTDPWPVQYMHIEAW